MAVVSTSNRWSDEFLDSMRMETDSYADKVVNDILHSTREEEYALKFFDFLIKNNDSIPDELPDIAKEYFKQTENLPPWADMNLIKKGEEIFNLYGPEFVLLLLCKSLPECYACWRGAQVLYDTGRLNEKRGNIEKAKFNYLSRRIMETSQFVLNVMAPGGLGPEGYGIRVTQKVRLMHAAIRHFIRKNEWDLDSWGEPINQEDLAGTLMAFSIELIDGIKLFNISLKPEDEEAYLHAWKVIGYILGIQQKLLPENVAEARELAAAILRRQVGPSKAGLELTRALIDFLEHIAPGNILDGLPDFMIHYLVGDTIADVLGVEKTQTHPMMLKFMRFLFGSIAEIEDHSKAMRKLTERYSRLLLQGLTDVYNDGKQEHFYIPPSLRKDWKITPAKYTLIGPILGWRLVLEKHETVTQPHRE